MSRTEKRNGFFFIVSDSGEHGGLKSKQFNVVEPDFRFEQLWHFSQNM